ncbi:MAG: Gfo/Idh/MocA family protein [Anaerolineales bacterium]
MLDVGIIGYGRRASHMAHHLNMFDIPYHVAAIADPRAGELQASSDPLLEETTFYRDADAMLEHSVLDGVMVGTRCHLHSEMACKVAAHDLPLFLEKPVAIRFEQLQALDTAFANVNAPTVVSFPLRLTPIVQKVKEIIEADTIGTVEHVVAFNDVPYGSVYYHRWYRNYDQVGGLFLQKATHDLDYINYLLDQRPVTIAATKAQRVFGGDKPFDLRCVDCEERETCPESPFTLFYQGFEGDKVTWDPDRMCSFSKGIRNQDLGNCIIEYEDEAQASYTQNFFARYDAARRGARLYGYEGTVHFDWYENVVRVHKHRSPTTETITFGGGMSHFGGDRELCLDFLRAMRDGNPSRSPLSAGILSALTCLWARESAETHRFCDIVMPKRSL